jgi:hypothetical protein
MGLGSENVKATNFLLVEYLKHNLLSVSKICDHGYNVKFYSPTCEIKEEDSKRLIATTRRILDNIYILDKYERKSIKSHKRDPTTITRNKRITRHKRKVKYY